MTYKLMIRFNKYCQNWTTDVSANEQYIHAVMKKWKSIFKSEGGIVVSDILRDLGASKMSIIDSKAWDYYILKSDELNRLDYELVNYQHSPDLKLVIPYNYYLALIDPPETDFE